ncbi:MAG: sensor histidine kinase, partial [Armatimonadota bacterium]
GSCADCAIIILHDLTEVRHHEKVQKEFVSNVGHELRTPLTAVRTTAEALLSGAKHDEAVLDRFLNTIISEIDRLSTLIDNLTEIVRVSSGIAPTEKSECSISEIVCQALEAVRPQAEKKNIEITVEVPQNLTGYCDGMQMVHVVRNLADNAVKYTPEGGSVRLWAGKEDSSIVIRVSDTGIGIPHGEIPRIFERFYRVDKARSRRLGGTGLGLSIVKEIVDAHGGEVLVESSLGSGSTFTVKLPPPELRPDSPVESTEQDGES